MRAIFRRLGGHNLSRPWVYDISLVLSCPKGFLSPLATSVLLNRGAKTVECGITWVKPIEPPSISKANSGDLEGVPEIAGDLVVPVLRDSDVLKEAPSEVQKLYTFHFLDRERRKDMVHQMLQDTVRRHTYDDDSPEVRLANQTASIRRLQVHMEQRPRDKKNKIVLKELIEKRKRRLKLLRRSDYKLFEWVLERLNLVYYPVPQDTLRPMRSVAMTEIATKLCEDLKAARLAKYREELEGRKPEFLMRKAQTMRAITEDEKKLKIAPSFTEEEILEVEKLRKLKVEELDKIPKPVEDIF